MGPAKVEHLCYTMGMADHAPLTLDEGITQFAQHLARRPLSINTRKAFVGDVRIFARFIQPGQSDQKQTVSAVMNSLNSDHIRAFLEQQERNSEAHSPKSLERRLTSLKVFFKWLRESGALAHDPADGVAYRPFQEPLPAYLSDTEVEQVLRAARQIAAGERLEMRPLTAILLVLETGIKKSECLNLTAQDIERLGAGQATILVRYEQKHLQFKTRQLRISDQCHHTLLEHIEHYECRDKLFDCTGRNLEYMFTRKVAPLAMIHLLTFETLRWTCAVRDYINTDLKSEQLQAKYGLSAIGWSEMEAKLARLTRIDYTARPDTDE